MTIAIVGGTGTLGRHVARELRARGHEVRIVSRHGPDRRVDLTTGAGLEPALAGCDIVVDAVNDPSAHAARTLVEGTQRLLAAELAAGVGHHVGVSIVGCDRVPMAYFRAKTEQERAIAAGPVPWSLVRATQFHELVAALLASAAFWHVFPAPSARLQPVAAAEVARVVAEVAAGAPRRGAVSVAGPEVMDVRTIVDAWRAATGRTLVRVPLPVPGELGRSLRTGALTVARPDVTGRTTFEAWLAAQPGSAGQAAPAKTAAGVDRSA